MHVKKKPETTTCIKWERLSIIAYTYRKKNEFNHVKCISRINIFTNSVYIVATKFYELTIDTVDKYIGRINRCYLIKRNNWVKQFLLLSSKSNVRSLKI